MNVFINESLDNQRSESKKSEDYEYNYAGEGCEEEYGENDRDTPHLGPADITQDTLKQIERKLCLIRLCWPPLDLGDSYLAQLPESYKTTSDKEKLLMWYAENFRKQYHTIYKDRKPLLMVRDNECGIQKFVSTSIRPSTLPYPELYTWQGCANFVSDHLEYEPLKKPLAMFYSSKDDFPLMRNRHNETWVVQFLSRSSSSSTNVESCSRGQIVVIEKPISLCSPTWLMRVQRGNIFEYATLLVSLLLGQGYNALVVSGYASREQVHCDMSMRSCPYLPKPAKPQTPPEPADTSRYRLKTPPNFTSRLLLELEANEEHKIQEKLQNREKEREKMLFEYERPPPDEYWGNRIHAWVVVLPEAGGPREHEVRTPFFIEPTSGMSYSPEDSQTNLLYHGVESVWNDSNYLVNMQRCSEGCSKIDWDLTNSKLWEHLLPGEPSTVRSGINQHQETDQEILIQENKHLDMPFSYVDNIDIHSLDFERRYPNGRKTLYFKKTKVEFYAPYVQMDGLLRKVTAYEDYEYRSPTRVYEKYLNRADNLVESQKHYDTDTVIDYYKRGRKDACKEHRYSTTGHDRTLNFYHVVRIDGLSRIQMDPLELTQHLVDRKDYLYHRHVEFSTENQRNSQDVYDRIIKKITEKYHRNPSVPATKDIAIREFDILENEIRLKYHYEKFDITRATKRFIKPPMAERGERPVFNPDLIQAYNPDPMALPEKQLDLFYELEKQLNEETKCLTLIRDTVAEIDEFLKIRSAEYIMPKLTVSLFDRNRNEQAKAGMFAKEEKVRAQSQREVEDKVDYLGAYLARLGNPLELTKFQAFHVRQECLNDLKKMLSDRANRISQELESCSKELKKIQNWFTQTEGKTREEQEEMLNMTNEMNFQLHTLDVRLQRHCELASERYRNMVKILRADKRLAALDD